MVLVWVYLWTRGQELIKNLCDLLWTQRGITGTFPLPCGLFWSGDAAHHILSTHTHTHTRLEIHGFIVRQHLLKTLPSCTSHWGKRFLLNTSVSTLCDDSKLLPASRRESVSLSFSINNSVCRWIIHVMMNAESRATFFPRGSRGNMCTVALCFILSFSFEGVWGGDSIHFWKI